MTDHRQLYIGGEWVAPEGTSTITVVSPSTEEVIGSVPEAAEADVDRAVEAARRAFDDPAGWASWSPAARAEVLERFAAGLDTRAGATAQAVSSQNGMPVQISQAFESVFPALLLRYYGKLVAGRGAEERRDAMFGGTTVVRREPIGVVGGIVPWNFPQALSFLKIAPALAAGGTIVVKPAPETVLDSYVMAEAGLPAGVLNIVPAGREVDLRREHTAWIERIHAVFFHQGAPRLGEGALRTERGLAALRQAAAIHLSPAGQLQVATALDMLAAIEARMDTLRQQLLHAARHRAGARALQAQLYGVGPLAGLAMTCWLGGAGRFSSSRKAVRFAGLDVTVYSSDGKRSPGHLSRQGPEILRCVAYEAGKTHARASAPGHDYYAAVKDRTDGKIAALAQARKLIRQACHILAELGDDALTAA